MNSSNGYSRIIKGLFAHGDYVLELHFGVSKSFERLRLHFCWPNMLVHLVNFIGNVNLVKIEKSNWTIKDLTSILLGQVIASVEKDSTYPLGLSVTRLYTCICTFTDG